MTDQAAFDEFNATLDAAMVRARRVAAEARETSAKFRRETGQLAAGLRSRTSQVTPAELTDDSLRRTATGFRTDNGLPLLDVPAGHELLAVPEPPATPGPLRTTGSRRRIPPPSDDDEDFSQEQIMR
ncbi:MAG TPA: hypothetical protein VH333_16040 [Pseudonocardiaceae bacterium]|jgi:hypothetical protein|nr:hypothetical protein [Pseudonocardiaceae bacterium]